MDKNIFVDTCFFKALVDIEDDFHQQAKNLWGEFRESKETLITSNFIVDEVLTLIRLRCGLKKAITFRDLLAENSQIIKIVRVTVTDEAGAWKWFEKDWSKLSYTDCVSFALIKRLGVKRVASFDEHFKRAGFRVEK
ncbi:MAG: PIN domain-containing protein [Candidatus Beckwithbacteria bacterium]|nr:PIN domain-containing protein [Patescibacteria group bacterium]